MNEKEKSDYKKNLSKLMKIVLKHLGLNQYSLAAKMNLKQGTISNWFRQYNISPEFAILLSKALDDLIPPRILSPIFKESESNPEFDEIFKNLDSMQANESNIIEELKKLKDK